jgi:hypothetical protein
MPRAADKRICGLALALLGATAHGQFRDVPPPPRLEGAETDVQAPPAEPPPPLEAEPTPFLERLRTARPPNAARLAPLPEERGDRPDEVIVIGSGWRLPDLGSDWRAEQAAENPPALGTTILPLYDPEAPTNIDTELLNREMTRIGYIELFRFRFGDRRRSAPTDE